MTSVASHSQALAVYKNCASPRLSQSLRRELLLQETPGKNLAAADTLRRLYEHFTFTYFTYEHTSILFFCHLKEITTSSSPPLQTSSYMYLDLTFLSRCPTMVIMEVPTIDCASLRGLLEADAPRCLVLDCRSFLSFNGSHIVASTNVRFSTIVRRRARGGLGLEHIVPNEDTRSRLLSGEYKSVVLLDDHSCDLSQAKKDGTLMLAVAALCRDPCGASVFILKGNNSVSLTFVVFVCVCGNKCGLQLSPYQLVLL